jgi:hypothetical protein
MVAFRSALPLLALAAFATAGIAGADPLESSSLFDASSPPANARFAPCEPAGASTSGFDRHFASRITCAPRLQQVTVTVLKVRPAAGPDGAMTAGELCSGMAAALFDPAPFAQVGSADARCAAETNAALHKVARTNG